MSQLSMTPEQREKFLADLHVGVIAVDRDERAPLAVPIWYGYEPGGDVYLSICRTPGSWPILCAGAGSWRRR